VTPTEILKHEHKIVLLILAAAEREGTAIRDGKSFQVDRLEQMMDFFRNFVDRCHHAKEERFLFPTMKEKSRLFYGDQVAMLLNDHKEGRLKVRDMTEVLPRAAAGDRTAKAALAESMLSYVALLRKHIVDREDGQFFPSADRTLTVTEQQQMTADFDRIETEELSDGVHEKYHQLAHDLTKH